MDRESRWLNSDSQILARVKRSSAKEGTLFSLTMPWGEELQAVLEKVDAASAQQFCNLARNTYDARKDEQEAKQARAAYDKEIRADERAAPERSEAPAPALEEGVDLLDVDSISRRVDYIRSRETELRTESERLRVERTKLLKILEVLNAPEDAEEEFQHVHNNEGEGEGDDA